MNIIEVVIEPFGDQRPGTSGLRKRVKVFQQPHYLEAFVQSIFDAIGAPQGAMLVVGGDGRFHNAEAVQTIVRMAAANGVGRLVIGRGGLLSTPATSNLIRRRGALGGIILSASHNPAGADGDFGVKYNAANGGPAPEPLTEAIYARSRVLRSYRTTDLPAVDLDRAGTVEHGPLTIEIVDPVEDYLAAMRQLFDFSQLRAAFEGGLRMRFDAMHAVTGPYARRIFEQELGAPPGSVVNAVPLPDFGGGHPDPNLVHAEALVAEMFGPQAPDFGAASDGDGDRNMILGRGAFVSPGDSLAILAANAHRVPGYARGLSGVARSLVTSRAVDRVAADLGIPAYATPTGWKFFGNLLDAGRITLCGEESFGTGSDHVREKDGVWAVLFWLNIIAATGLSVADLQKRHWARYGRDYFTRHDFEAVDTDAAGAVMAGLRSIVQQVAQGRTVPGITDAMDFAYTDPVDGSISTGQGLCFWTHNDGRLLFRMSGTGSEGATLRMYVERYEPVGGVHDLDAQQALAALIQLGGTLAGFERLGIGAPTTVT